MVIPPTKTSYITDRLSICVRECGVNRDSPICFLHGNLSSSFFWEDTLGRFGQRHFSFAPDLRGFGDTQASPIDATLGLEDIVEDICQLCVLMDIESCHFVGHSMGGGVAMKLLIRRPELVRSLTLVNPMSPFGYGGSKDECGTPCFEDGAPAGAASVNPEFVERLALGDRGSTHPFAPLNVVSQFYFHPSFSTHEMSNLVESVLKSQIGEDWYPGNSIESENWPGKAPGDKGILNAISRRYFDASGITEVETKKPILWIRSDQDLIVSDNAMFDAANLGSIGAIPDWPGESICPPQPMLQQTRFVLNKYRAQGGDFSEVVVEGAGHTPFIEKADEFEEWVSEFLIRL